jgi:hypothetical protein
MEWFNFQAYCRLFDCYTQLNTKPEKSEIRNPMFYSTNIDHCIILHYTLKHTLCK